MKKREFFRLLPYILLAMALIMCVAGAVTGEAASIFIKAINICLECIGIG